jgi:hypothetical protein
MTSRKRRAIRKQMADHNEKLPAPVYRVEWTTADDKEHHQEYPGDLHSAQTCFDLLSRHGRDVVEVELTERHEGAVEGIDLWRKATSEEGPTESAQEVNAGYDEPQAAQKPVKQRHNAEAAYENSHLAAQDLLEHIRELLFDLPAPGSEVEIHWGHVGTVTEVNRRLAELVEFLTSATRP